MIVRELVTLLKFKTQGQGELAKFKALGESMQAKLKPMQNYLDMQDKIDQVKKMQELAKNYKNKDFAANAVLLKMRQMQNYKNELKQMSTQERKKTLELNALERMAERKVKAERVEAEKFVRAEQRTTAKEQELARRRQIEHVRNLHASYLRIATAASRITIGAGTTAIVSFANAYKEYKKYKESLAKGQAIKTSLSPEAIKKFDVFDKVFSRSKNNALEFRNAIAVQLLPELTKLLNSLNAWYEQNKQVINSEFVTWLKRALTAIIAIKVATTGLQIAQAFNLITNSIGAMGGVAMTTNGSVALLGVALTRVAFPLATLYLAFDDFFTFLRGGDSVIGRTIENLKRLGQEVGNIKKKYLGESDLSKGQNTATDIERAYKQRKNSVIKFGAIMSDKVKNEVSTVNNNQKLSTNVNVTLGGITLNASGSVNSTEIEKSLKVFQESLSQDLTRKITAQIDAKQQADLALTMQNFGY